MNIDKGLIEAAKTLSESKALKSAFAEITKLVERGDASDAAHAASVAGACLRASGDLLVQLAEAGVDTSEWGKRLRDIASEVNRSSFFEEMVHAALTADVENADEWVMSHAEGYMELVQEANMLRTALTLAIDGAPTDEEIKREWQI